MTSRTGARWEDVLLLGLVLLQDVVLDGPASAGRSTPVRSATPMYIAMTTGAAELIVIDVLTEPRSIPSKSDLHVGQGVDRHAGPAHLALGQRVVGVPPEKGRHVEGGREAVTARAQELFEPRVGVLGRAEPGELAHRPEPRAVHGGVGPRV